MCLCRGPLGNTKTIIGGTHGEPKSIKKTIIRGGWRRLVLNNTVRMLLCLASQAWRRRLVASNPPDLPKREFVERRRLKRWLRLAASNRSDGNFTNGNGLAGGGGWCRWRCQHMMCWHFGRSTIAGGCQHKRTHMANHIPNKVIIGRLGWRRLALSTTLLELLHSGVCGCVTVENQIRQSLGTCMSNNMQTI